MFLHRHFARGLALHGPSVGLLFKNRNKNYIYVPLKFLEEARAMFPDAVFVTDEPPGTSPSHQLKLAVTANQLAAPENNGRLLVTSVGIEKLMGSPFRVVEPEAEAGPRFRRDLRSLRLLRCSPPCSNRYRVCCKCE